MQDFADKKILVGICGGIAAYKSVYLIRELTRLGAQVRVVLTIHAQEFITPMTVQALTGYAPRTALFDAEAERAMGHIELARWADYLVIAPASANCLAKLAHGHADDLLSTLYLVTQAPVFICPAMNQSMWAHPAVQANCATLMARGAIMVGPSHGDQACGEVGMGRMSEPFEIIDALRLGPIMSILQGRDVLITAGPTHEALDPVRFLSNRSSGKMGYALARAARAAGANVTLISGPTALAKPDGITFIGVESAEEMLVAVKANLQQGIIFIGAAAVADYHIKQPAQQKVKKDSNSTVALTLIKNPDILAYVAQVKQAAFVVGFAAETENVIEHARTKLERKHVDMIIANQVGPEQGFNQDNNQVTLVTADGERTLPLMHKVRLAAEIMQVIAQSISRN